MTRAYKEACERLAVAEAEIKRWQAMIESNGRDNQREGGEDYKSIKAQCEEYEKQIGMLNDTVAELQTKKALEGKGAAIPTGEIKAFREWLQKGIGNGANNTVVGERGGVLVPAQLYDRILLQAEADCVIRKLATKITVSGSSIDVPVEDNDNANDTEFVGELTPKSGRPVTFRNVHIPIFDIFRAVPVTTQLLDDAAFPIENHIMAIIARQIAETEEKTYLGNVHNTDWPISIHETGLVPSMETGAKGKITYDDMINIMTASDDVARSSVMQKASFIIHPRTLQTLRREKTSGSGEYVMQPIAQGMPPTIAGIPVYTSTAISSNLTESGDNIIAVYGDIGGGFMIADRKDMEMLRNPYITMGQVVFQFTKREGGGVVDPKRLAKMKVVSK